MELIANATLAAPAVVLVMTELLKLVPTHFTRNYPAWVNGILSFIAALVVVRPAFELSDLGALLGVALYIAVVAAIAYNQFVSKLKKA